MPSEETSFSPALSSSRTILETICSMRPGSTARLRSAICTERISLSRSNGTRRPLRLIKVSSRNCTRSNVVKRKLQVRQTRRRRMAAESSVGRESFTWVSRLAQLGQRICPSILVDRKPRDQLLDLRAHGLLDRRIRLDLLVREHIEHFHDQLADLPEFGNAKSPRGARRRAQPHARRHGRFLGIEGDAVLVAGDMRPPE